MTSALTRSIALAVLLYVGLAGTAESGDTVNLRIGCVLANNSDRGFDQRLVSLRHRFHRMFRYTSYSLVKEKRERVPLGAKFGFDVPGGRYLLVIPKEMHADGRLTMKVMLLEGARAIVDTAVSIHSDSIFLVAGPQENDGALILSIGMGALE